VTTPPRRPCAPHSRPAQRARGRRPHRHVLVGRRRALAAAAAGPPEPLHLVEQGCRHRHARRRPCPPVVGPRRCPRRTDVGAP
jgi:hypothetical protein